MQFHLFWLSQSNDIEEVETTIARARENGVSESAEEFVSALAHLENLRMKKGIEERLAIALQTKNEDEVSLS